MKANPTLFYLAAPFGHKIQARAARSLIESQLGWKCTSRWIDNHLEDSQPPAIMRREANCDVADIIEAEEFILLNTGYSEGKMFELGYAVSDDMPVALIGEPTHIFHHLACIKRYATVEDFINERRER